MESIKLRKLFIAMVVAELVMMSLVALMGFRYFTIQRALSKAEKERYEMTVVADQLRQSSDDMTKFARAYAATGVSTYYDDFFRVLDIRNGQAPRPEYYQYIYWDYLEPLRSQIHPQGEIISLDEMINNQPYTTEEIAKIQESHQNSDDLVSLEMEAFNAMKGLFKDGEGAYTIDGAPDQAMALTILYSDAYFEAKQEIMGPIDDFMRMMTSRINGEIEMHQQDLIKTGWMLMSVIMAFVVINIEVFVIMDRRVIGVISNMTLRIQDIEEDSGYFTELAIPRNDELGQLAHELNVMQQAIRSRNEKLVEKDHMIDHYINIIEFDMDRIIVDASEAFCNFSGYSIRELIGRNLDLFQAEFLSGTFNVKQDNLKGDEQWHVELKGKKIWRILLHYSYGY